MTEKSVKARYGGLGEVHFVGVLFISNLYKHKKKIKKLDCAKFELAP